MRRSLHDIALAAAFAASVSGAPSSTHAALTGRSPLAAARAAGTLIPGRADRPSVAGGLAVHAAVSAGWAGVLGLVLPRRHTVAAGALAGLGIAAFDLVVVGGRRRPAMGALPQAWQWADHVVFGAAVGWVLSRTDAAPA
jgi:hypothetical protein